MYEERVYMRSTSATICSRHWFLALLALLLWQTGYAGHHPDMSRPSGKTLGVTIGEVPFESLAAVGLDYGVRVLEVTPGSPADTAGIEDDDIVVELDEKPVYSVVRLQWLVRQAPEGTPVSVKLRRQDKLETTSVTFQPSQPVDDAIQGQSSKAHHWRPKMHHRSPGAFLGIQFQPMTEQLRAAFGAPSGEGVLVVALVEGGPAQQAGLAVGDIIVRMDRKTISNMQDFYRVLAYFDAGDAIEVEVIRDETSQVLSARLGAVPMNTSHFHGHGHPPIHPPATP